MQKAVHRAYKAVDPEAKCSINGTSGDHVIGLSSVSASEEALPICVPPTIMSVHYTPVIQEVVHKNAELLDIDSEDLSEFP